MVVIKYVMLAFALLGTIDRIIGNKIGVGKEFERGVSMLGPLTLSMGGMLILAPAIAELFLSMGVGSILGIDISVIPSVLLANDMGAAHIATLIAEDIEIGLFNGLIVSSMMGGTVSFTIPYVMQVVKKEYYGDVIFGILIGMITIPLGCIVGGIVCGVPFFPMLLSMIPLIVFVIILAVGILKFEKITVKIFIAFGWIMKTVIAIGLIIGVAEFMLGVTILTHSDTLMSVAKIVFDIACIMMGAFPLLYIIRKLLSGAAKPIAKWLGINEASVFGLVFTLGNSVTTFAMLGEMDKKGIVINSAFAVSAAFVLIDHLAFTLAFNSDYVPGMIVGKLLAGISAVCLANLIYNRRKNNA